MARRKQHKYNVSRPASEDSNIIAFEEQTCKGCGHIRIMVRENVKGIDPTPRDWLMSMDNIREYGLEPAPCPVTPEWNTEMRAALSYQTEASRAYRHSIDIMEGRALGLRRNTL